MHYQSRTLTGEGKPELLARIQASRVRLQENARRPITYRTPLIEREGVGLLYPNTISVVQGKSGQHKSRLVEAICASALADGMHRRENPLGFSRSDGVSAFRVLYVDTERNEDDQFPAALQAIKRMAGFPIEAAVPGFDFFSLIDVGRQQRLEALSYYLHEYDAATVEDPLLVVLDVVTDCVDNFNDVASSMALIDVLNREMSRQCISFLCVIHENPNSVDKARGHLGTEMLNKSSLQLQIGFEKDQAGKESDVLKVSCLKHRSHKRFAPFYLRYDEQLRTLVCVDATEVAVHADARRSALTLQDLKDFLLRVLNDWTTRADMIHQVMAQFPCSQSTVNSRLKELQDESNQLVLRADTSTPRLEQKKESKNVFYRMLPNR